MYRTTEEHVEPAATAGDVPVLELSGVSKAYDGQLAVQGIDLSVRRGEFFALLGPSGCGKSTTLRLVGGFAAPDAGVITIDAVDVAGVPPYGRDVNTVFQSYALFPHLSVAENIAFGLRERRRERAEIRRRVAEALELVRLADVGQRKPAQLSGGQQQRVALARALVNRPALLLLDEPLGALDLKLRKEMQMELKAIQRDVGITFIHVTHDQEEALTMADRLAIMAGGRIEQIGSPADVYERPATRFVADFVGRTSFLAGTLGDPGRFRLECGEDVSVRAVAPEVRGAGVLAIRPEAVQVAPGAGDPPPGNAVRARVLHTIYEGPAISYELEIAGGGVLLASSPNAPGSRAPACRAGDAVWASWDQAAGRVLPA